MNLAELNAYLMKEDYIEKIQKKYGANINTMDLEYKAAIPPKIGRESLFKDGNIFINKHRRYAAVPNHTHDFVEMNYMYSGSCVQSINGKKILLEKGDLLIIDREATQSIENTSENDLMINILLKEETLSTDILMNLASTTNLVSSFMLNASKSKGEHDQFIHFSSKENDRLSNLLVNLLLVYFEEYSHKHRTLNLYLSLILIELTNLLEQRQIKNAEPSNSMIKVLDYINRHFDSTTLELTAAEFGYNPVYLSNKLKKQTGSSFQELVNSKRYALALELVKETNQTMEEIAERVGYQQSSSLFKLFRKYANQTPSELRKMRE